MIKKIYLIISTFFLYCSNPANEDFNFQNEIVYDVCECNDLRNDTIIAPNDSAANFCDTCFKTYILPEKPILDLPCYRGQAEDTITLTCRMNQDLNDTFYINLYDKNHKFLFTIFKLYSPITYNFTVTWNLSKNPEIKRNEIYRIQAKHQDRFIEYWIKL